MTQQRYFSEGKIGLVKGYKNYRLKLFCTFFACLLVMSVFAQLPEGAKLFNDGWSFHKGDLDSANGAVTIKAGDWQPVDLPHDWSILAPFSQKWASATGYLPGGIGWYKKAFNLNKQYSDGKYFIYFGGIYKHSKVWLNGHLLGRRPNGFVSFFYELTPYLKNSGSNELLVKVDHSAFADSRWYTGSGIYRNVYLVKTPNVYIPIWGVHVETKAVAGDQAILKVNTDIVDNFKQLTNVSAKNERTNTPNLRIAYKLLDSAGKVITETSKSVSDISAANRSVSITDSLIVRRPMLWSVEHPYLYTLITSVIVNGHEQECFKTAVGIRTVRFDSDKGFFLNGENLKLKGVCLHDDAGSFGTAVPIAVWQERLELLKQVGCNAIRMTHNPHATGLYDLCDKLGFLVIDEAFDEWELGKHKWIAGWNKGTPGTDGYHSDFKQWWRQDLTDMIQRDRNHPSIIMWSIGNEIDYPNDPYSNPVLNEGHYPQIYGSGYMKGHPSAEALGRISKQLSTLTHSLDPSRPVTAGLAAVMVSDKVGYTDVLDVAGYNYQEYRYEKDHDSYPKRIIYGSENGHGYAAWQAVSQHPFVMGQFLWTGIDYLGEAGRWPDHGNEAGLINMAGYKKPEFYFRQSIWSKQPMVYLGTSRIQRRNGRHIDLKNSRHSMARPDWNYKEGDSVNVYCYTNCDRATLYLNGVSLGSKGQTDSTHVIVWQVPYQKGTLAVKAGSSKGQILTDSLVSYGQPDHIDIKSHALVLQNGEPQYYALDINIVDNAGNTVQSDHSLLKVEVGNNCKLVGLENGNVRDSLQYGANVRSVYLGRLRAYIACEPGKKEFEVPIKIQQVAPGGGLKPVKYLLRGGHN